MVEINEVIKFRLFERKTKKLVYKAGYGRCSRCNCAGFEADYRNNEVCSNCGHNFRDHW